MFFLRKPVKIWISGRRPESFKDLLGNFDVSQNITRSIFVSNENNPIIVSFKRVISLRKVQEILVQFQYIANKNFIKRKNAHLKYISERFFWN